MPKRSISCRGDPEMVAKKLTDWHTLINASYCLRKQNFCSVRLQPRPRNEHRNFPVGTTLCGLKFRKGEVDWHALTHATYYSIVRP